CLGIGVDPLTFATDILTAVTIDAPLYDDLFGQVTGTNAEGSILPAIPFTAEIVDRYASREPTQAAGAGLLWLACRHRSILLTCPPLSAPIWTSNPVCFPRVPRQVRRGGAPAFLVAHRGHAHKYGLYSYRLLAHGHR